MVVMESVETANNKIDIKTIIKRIVKIDITI